MKTIKKIYKTVFLDKKQNKSLMDYPFFNFNNLDNDINEVNIAEYYNNAIVHQCINIITNAAAHIPWKIYSNSGKEKRLITNHPAAKLLKKPNNFKSGSDFFNDNIANLLLYGNSYMLVNIMNNKPIEIFNLKPSLVDIIYKNNIPIAYQYGQNKKTNFKYPINPINGISQIMHLSNYNPNEQFKGISSLNAAKKPINLYSKIMDWNNSLLKNAIRPSGALILENDHNYLTDDQFERLQEQFYKNFSGSCNSGKPLILEGGLKWQETGHAERFEKFIELKDSSARDIAIAFNIPPNLLGIKGDNTYSNMQEARLALWEENIIPLLDKYSTSLSNWFSYWYEEDLLIDFDRDAISVLTERRENLWSKISKCSFMTINEKRSIIGLDPIKNGDKF